MNHEPVPQLRQPRKAAAPLYPFHSGQCYADSAQELETAQHAMHALEQVYPRWLWRVIVRGGVLNIKLGDVSQKWGMVRKLKNVHYSASNLKREVVMAAGEFLERALQARGPRELEQFVKRVEGIPQKDIGR